MSSKFYVIETLFQFYDVLHSLTDKQSKNIEDESINFKLNKDIG